jgi:hypothetical protein
MKNLTLVCHYSRPLLDQIEGYDIVIKVDQFQDIPRVADDIRSSGNVLKSVVIEIEKPLSTIQIQEDCDGIPIALFAPEMGNFRDISNQIQRMREFKIHIYMPVEKRENLVNSRILASLGVTCCLVFGQIQPEWEALSDLMTYALFGINSHAPVEPFNHLALNYKPSTKLSCGDVYFDGPGEFLYLDANGRVSLSYSELSKGSFIAEHISMIKNPVENEEYRRKINAWRQLFLSNHPCIICEGWKICLGRFGLNGTHKPKCSIFVADMLAEIEQYQDQRQSKS